MEIEEEARAAGANAFLPKPLYRSSVYETIQSALEWERWMPSSTELRHSCLKGKRLLVAEDNELNREIVKELLAMNGVQAESAVNGKVALEVFLASEPGYFDAILMDIQMPVMNGYEATQKIRISEHPDAKKFPLSLPLRMRSAMIFQRLWLPE